jgi:hypothetical protein
LDLVLSESSAVLSEVLGSEVLSKVLSEVLSEGLDLVLSESSAVEVEDSPEVSQQGHELIIFQVGTGPGISVQAPTWWTTSQVSSLNLFPLGFSGSQAPGQGSSFLLG